MAVAAAAGTPRNMALRHRRNARTLTAGQLASYRKSIAAPQKIDDDRGYQAWAGIHGLVARLSVSNGAVCGRAPAESAGAPRFIARQKPVQPP